MNRTLKSVIEVLFLVIILIVTLIFILPRYTHRWDFINDKTCDPPCLANIIPGVTTQADVLSIVSANKVFGSCNLVDATKDGGIKYIHCQLHKRFMNITLDADRVDGIGIHPYPSYSLQTVIDRFGFPENISCGLVNLPDNSKRVEPILWFDNYSIAVLLPERNADQCVLSPSLKIEMIVYASIDHYRDSKEAAQRLKSIISWQGFKAYPGRDLP